MEDVAKWFESRAETVAAGPSSVVVHSDNYDGMPAGSVDAILTDPPFNVARKSNFHTYDNNRIHSYQVDGDKGWDTHEHGDFVGLLHSWAMGFERVLRPGGSFAVFCADAYVSHLIDALTAANLKPKRTFTWRKPNAVPVNRAYMPMSACEFVVYGVKGNKPTFNADLTLDEGGHLDKDPEGLLELEAYLVADKTASLVAKAVRLALLEEAPGGREDRPKQVNRILGRAIADALPAITNRIENMYTADPNMLRACIPNYLENPSATGRNRTHPTEKPVSALRYFVAMMSKPGDLILDPFAGSGSTGEAAVGLGRRVVLIEREHDYYVGAASRVAGTPRDQRQLTAPDAASTDERPAESAQTSLLDDLV